MEKLIPALTLNPYALPAELEGVVIHLELTLPRGKSKSIHAIFGASQGKFIEMRHEGDTKPYWVLLSAVPALLMNHNFFLTSGCFVPTDYANETLVLSKGVVEIPTKGKWSGRPEEKTIKQISRYELDEEINFGGDMEEAE